MDNIEKIAKEYLETRDIKLRDELIEYFIPQADKMANSFAKKYELDIDDVTSFAYQSLWEIIESLNSCDFNHMVHFVNLVLYRKLNGKLKTLSSIGSETFMNSWILAKEEIIEKESKKQMQEVTLEDNLYLVNNILELMNKRGLKLRDIITLKEKIYGFYADSLDKLQNVLADNNSAIERIEFDVTMDAILKDKEKQVMKYRYGLDGSKPITIREIAKIMNLNNHQHVSWLENRALSKLRKLVK